MHNGFSYKCRTCFCTQNSIYSAGTMLSLYVTSICDLCQGKINWRVAIKSWGGFPLKLSSCRSEGGRMFWVHGRSLRIKTARTALMDLLAHVLCLQKSSSSVKLRKLEHIPSVDKTLEVGWAYNKHFPQNIEHFLILNTLYGQNLILIKVLRFNIQP